MRMLRELMPVHSDTAQISRVREARRELERSSSVRCNRNDASSTAGMNLNKG